MCRARRAYPQRQRRGVSRRGCFKVIFMSTGSERRWRSSSSSLGWKVLPTVVRGPWSLPQSGSSLRTRVDNLTETCSLWESCCLSSRRGGHSLRREPEDRAKAGGNGVDSADRSASHDTLLKEGGVIQRACAQLFPQLDSGRGGSSPSPGLAVYTRRSFPWWEPWTQL